MYVVSFCLHSLPPYHLFDITPPRLAHDPILYHGCTWYLSQSWEVPRPVTTVFPWESGSVCGLDWIGLDWISPRPSAMRSISEPALEPQHVFAISESALAFRLTEEQMNNRLVGKGSSRSSHTPARHKRNAQKAKSISERKRRLSRVFLRHAVFISLCTGLD